MLVHAVLGNSQRLDGGAMYGNVPRALWSRWSPPDELGRIALSCRALLVQHEGKNILLETGIGAFFEPQLRERFGVVEDTHVLLGSLASLGLSPADIDVVILSHLHFDHAGGLLAPYAAGEAPRLVFERARFVVGEGALARARAPHPRDRASFIPELPDLLAQSGRLEIVPDDAEQLDSLGPAFRFRRSHGHTPAMLHTWITGREQSIFFCADLVPGVPWVHLPVTMGYDRYPERLIDEKREIFAELRSGNAWLFFTHDPDVACARLSLDERGKYGAVHPRAELGFDLNREFAA